jgi:hypothetical protein
MVYQPQIDNLWLLTSIHSTLMSISTLPKTWKRSLLRPVDSASNPGPTGFTSDQRHATGRRAKVCCLVHHKVPYIYISSPGTWRRNPLVTFFSPSKRGINSIRHFFFLKHYMIGHISESMASGSLWSTIMRLIR